MSFLVAKNYSALHLMWEDYLRKEFQKPVGFGIECWDCNQPCMRQCACAEKEFIASLSQKEVDTFVANGMKTTLRT